MTRLPSSPLFRAVALALWALLGGLLIARLRLGTLSDAEVRKPVVLAILIGLAFYGVFRRANMEGNPDDRRNYFPTWFDRVGEVATPLALIVAPLLFIILGSFLYP